MESSKSSLTFPPRYFVIFQTLQMYYFSTQSPCFSIHFAHLSKHF